MIMDAGISSFMAWNVGHPKLLKSRPEKLIIKTELARGIIKENEK